MASLLLPPQFLCSLPCSTNSIRSHLHYKPHFLGNIMTKPKAKMRLLNRNVSSMAKKSSQDVAEGSSDDESDGETSKTKKRAPRRGRKKATIQASEGETQEGQVSTEEDESPEGTKKIKRRGRKKAATTASSSEEKDKAKEPKKRGRRKVKTVEELSDNEGEDLGEDLVPSNDRQEKISANDLESKIAALLLEDTDDNDINNLIPLVCCFGPAKYSFIPSGRPANRLIDHEIHEGMKDMFWSPDQFVRAPGGSSSNVALALAASGGRVEFMGKLGDDDYGQSTLYHLNVNGVQTRAIKMDPSAFTAMSLMKVTGRGSLKMSCAKPCAEDCFVQTDINPAVLKEAKMFYYNSSALLEPTTRSSLSKAIEVSKKFGGVTFFDLNLPLPLWSSSKETKSLVKEAWEAADIIEITKQELEFLCGIKPSEKFGTKDNDKSKFTHYSPEVVTKLWHENLKVLFVTNGTSKIHYYTKEHDGWVRGTEDAPITPFTGDMSQSGDAIVAALMKMLAINPHLVTDKDYLHTAMKHAITCGVIDQWLLARERGFLPRERADPTSEQFGVRFVTEKEYRTLPDSIHTEDSSESELLYVE
ncbi:hypothetical protein OsJ_11670 [Oryza sativa Japonica Group]|nr:hypothetical protein OsJ_11670 [Oryza sativa Japonica Group]